MRQAIAGGTRTWLSRGEADEQRGTPSPADALGILWAAATSSRESPAGLGVLSRSLRNPTGQPRSCGCRQPLWRAPVLTPSAPRGARGEPRKVLTTD